MCPLSDSVASCLYCLKQCCTVQLIKHFWDSVAACADVLQLMAVQPQLPDSAADGRPASCAQAACELHQQVACGPTKPCAHPASHAAHPAVVHCTLRAHAGRHAQYLRPAWSQRHSIHATLHQPPLYYTSTRHCSVRGIRARSKLRGFNITSGMHHPS